MPAAAERLRGTRPPSAAAELAIEPTLEQVRALAAAAGDGAACELIPLRHSFIADCETPVSAFLKLRALAPSEPAFLLESADQGQRVGRWSFIGVRPRSVLRWSLGDPGDPYALAAELVAGFRQMPPAGDASDPAGARGMGMGGAQADEAPFLGGAVGFFGYDLVRTVEPLGGPGGSGADPAGAAGHGADALRRAGDLRPPQAHRHDPRERRGGRRDAAHRRRDRAPVRGRRGEHRRDPPRARRPGAAPERVGGFQSPRETPRFESNMPRAQFEGMVERIVRYIHAGDAFQVVPSQRWSAPVPVEAFSIYRGLRAVNPSPYMYYLDFGDFQVAGASPEPLLTVNGRHVSTRPIAGTRPRGASPEEDRRIAAELLADEKERSEHVMLVDLGRNDLGRVCEYGSVTVDELMEIEYYSHVMHIVSSVSGTLRADVGAMDALRSVLPAGTLSGAPKVRAMQIIDELEPVKRGGYGGAIGYLSYGGDLDTAIHIRTVVVKDGVAHIQAGGGTVADAKPAYEYEESVAKSTAAMRAIALACEQADWAC